jgi:hypothetical protein
MFVADAAPPGDALNSRGIVYTLVVESTNGYNRYNEVISRRRATDQADENFGLTTRSS